MCSAIDELVIRVDVEASSWQEAIEKAGSVLVEKGSITEDYIKEMIQSVYDLGPYMVLTKGFALVHAKPSNAVMKSDISLITLKSSVNFNSKNDPVKVILCLASKDKISHVKNLKIIAERLMIDGVIEMIASCSSEDQVYQLLKYGLKR